MSVTIERSACLGICPVYRLEIDEAGHAKFVGEAFVLLVGQYSFAIPSTSVDGLIDASRDADFFNLRDEYRYPVSDIPTTTVSIVIDARDKTVVDHAGLRVGMPSTVTQLEEAIDSAAGIDRWTVGTPETLVYLDEIGFSFDSRAGAQLLARASVLSDEDFIFALIGRGAARFAPVSEVPGMGAMGQSPLLNSIRRGHTRSAQALLREGYINRASAQERASAFAEAERHGYAEIASAIAAE